MIPRVRPSLTRRELCAVLLPTRDARRELERALARCFGMREAILFPYGRSAVYGLMRAMELRGEVIQSAYNCVVVAHATVKAEGVPVFIDCERDGPNQDADAMVDGVNQATAAVIPTSIFGHTFDAPQLVERIRRKNKNAFVIMDCAQAFTARWNRDLLAAQGDAAVLAFGIGKAMTTLFGGAVLTNREDVAARVRAWQRANFVEPSATQQLIRVLYFFAAWGGTTGWGTILADQMERSKAMSSALVKGLRSRERVALPKTNQTYLGEREAAIGLAQISRLEGFIQRRHAISQLYESELKQTTGIKLPTSEEGATDTIYSMRLDEPAARDQVLNELRARGVQGGTVLDYVVPALECYRELGYKDAYPNAREWARRALNLPNHPALTDEEVKRCAGALREALIISQSVLGAPASHVHESIS